MRLLSLDFEPVYGENATCVRFSDQESVFDYDVVIWNPSDGLSNYGLDPLYSFSVGSAETMGEVDSRFTAQERVVCGLNADV